ncbi:hypothetical protein [Kocuria carniphila]|uniref:hypothetical protein n=1 Tax=Kocuria carniphila TaxID=262208 RepID=UPI00101B7F56|nr:hypothetical protein [Kocuria carniphila]
MVRAESNFSEFPKMADDAINVSVMVQSGLGNSAAWERSLCDAIEKMGYKTHVTPFGGKGAAAGGDLSIFEMIRMGFEIGGGVGLLAHIESRIKARKNKKVDEGVLDGASEVKILQIDLVIPRCAENSSKNHLTLRDLIATLPGVREAIDDFPGRYLVNLSAPVDSGGGVAINYLERGDLEGRALDRISSLIDASAGNDQLLMTRGSDLRNFFWKPVWVHAERQ